MIKELLQLFTIFFKISICTTGGGYAMLPMFRRELIEKYGWTTDEEILNYYAISQSLPGIIAVNIATFVGYRKRGFLGAIFAICGVVLPSLIIIIIIAVFFNQLSQYVYVQKALLGVRIAVASLLSVITLGLIKNSLKNVFTILVFLAVIVAILGLKMSPVYVVLLSILAGFLYWFISFDKNNEKGSKDD